MPNQKESQAAGLPPMINLGLSAEDAPHTKTYETNPISAPVVLPSMQDNNQAATGVLNIAAASFGVLYARAE